MGNNASDFVFKISRVEKGGRIGLTLDMASWFRSESQPLFYPLKLLTVERAVSCDRYLEFIFFK